MSHILHNKAIIFSMLLLVIQSSIANDTTWVNYQYPISLNKLDNGKAIGVIWAGLPIMIVKRTDDDIKRLDANGHLVKKDNPPKKKPKPQFQYNFNNSLRSHTKQFSVYVTLGSSEPCSLVYVPFGQKLRALDGDEFDIGPDWVGGFYNTCDGSKYDLAGRVLINSKARYHLVSPKYRIDKQNQFWLGK